MSHNVIAIIFHVAGKLQTQTLHSTDDGSWQDYTSPDTYTGDELPEQKARILQLSEQTITDIVGDATRFVWPTTHDGRVIPRYAVKYEPTGRWTAGTKEYTDLESLNYYENVPLMFIRTLE